MSAGWSSPLGRLLSQARLGILACLVPPGLVDEALAVAGRDERRWRALPARLGVYFLLALPLLATKSYASVIRAMIPAPALPVLDRLGWRVPCSAALSALRDRLGAVPAELLFTAMTRARPSARTGWSHAFGLQLLAIDGTEIALADTAANAHRFRRHRGPGGNEAGPPKARLLVLLACGTRQLAGAVFDDLGRGEATLSHRLVPRLRPGTLLLADRNFLSHRLWTSARAQGAHLLWRAKTASPRLPVDTVLPDGSYLSRLHDPDDARAWRRQVRRNRKRGHRPPKPRPVKGITVRVVEALITVTADGATRTERYRLVTSLLDPGHAPAARIADCYARRWAAETGIRDLKTVLLAGRPLRAATPVRASQELWAALVTYQAIRMLIATTAARHNLDPARLSFTAARDAAQHAITITPAQAPAHLDWVCTDLTRQLITKHTSHRVFPRALKNTNTRYPHRTSKHPTSTNTSYHTTITTPPADQP
ncbi:IS4 family transposase, partial [Amycolatopsis halotolerans]